MAQPLDGLDSPTTPPNPTPPPQQAVRRRSRAWIYYAILTVACLIAAFSHPAALLGMFGFGAYAWYLFRGGRIVIWFW